MNLFLPSVYDELISRLALGIEVVDAVRGQPVTEGVSVAPDAGRFRKPFTPRSGGRFAVLHDRVSAGTAQDLSLRLAGAGSAARRFVPRRLRITIPALADAESSPPSQRGCRPRLFPGAAYPLVGGATGLRGQAFRATGGPRRPARWTRVLASIPASESNLAVATIIGRGFGDDRGEFLLPLDPGAARGTPTALIAVRISVFAPPVEPAPPPGGVGDPMWDAPLEHPATHDEADPVLLGSAMPEGWSLVAARSLNLRLGRLEESASAFEF